MKQVFSDISNIAHLWANQLQNYARNSGNFYFDGNTIYSYGRHFPIAKHVENDNGEKAVLITERTYSNTTARHIQVVRSAISHKYVIYCYSPDSTHSENFHHWAIQAENIASNLAKARKPEKYLNEIEQVRYRAERYASFFGIEIPETARQVLSIGDTEEFKQYMESKKALAEAEAKAAELAEKKKHKKALGSWLKGKSHRLYTRNGRDYLRVNGDAIETTQAVSLPFEYAKKLWQRVRDGKLKQGDKVLDYEVAEVGKDISIGCHTFPVKYLIEFGNKVFK